MEHGLSAIFSKLSTFSHRAPARISLLSFLAALLLTTASPQAATATDRTVPVVRAAVLGTPDLAPDRTSAAERVVLDRDLASSLLRTPEESSLVVSDWPVAPGVRADVKLTRHDVYAPGAKVYRVEGERMTEIPHSKLVFLWGSGEGGSPVGVSLSVDPDTGELRGLTQSEHGLHEMRRSTDPGKVGAQPEYLVAKPEAFFAGGSSSTAPSWTCGEETLTENMMQSSANLASAEHADQAVLTSVGLKAAVVAFDTDNEMMARFSDNTSSVTTYIASLVATMNVMYERDLSIHLLQGTTLLRVSTVADPYNQSGSGNADGLKLQEFSNYWAANEGSVPRTLAAMLSGKQPAGSASGIAWVSGLCSSSAGYSFSQVATSVAVDGMIVGHEIGHNFGSPHTHCYNPPVDTCRSGEVFANQACYSGATSCPASTTINGVTNTGTLMSYCHLIGCTTPTGMMVFHPRTVSEKVGPAIAAASCIVPFGSSVTAVSPNSGSTSGGTHVTITGANFVAGAAVTIGGVAATGISVVNSTTITATTAAHATGGVDVVVTNPASVAATLTKGYFYAPAPTTTGLFTLTPCRLLDTRNANGPLGGPSLGAGAQRIFNATAACGVPSTAKSISANITVITPTASGDLSTFPGNAFPLGTIGVGFRANLNRSNNAVIELATDGTGTFGVFNNSSGTVELVVDINGYFQ